METPVAETPAPRASHARPALAWPRRLAWPTVSAAAVLALFAAYLRQAQTVPVMSDGAANALQAWDLLHGNVLLRGWTMSDVSFYTTEIPQYMLVEMAHGLNADVVHIAAAMSYTLLVLGAAVLARGADPPRPPREGMARGADPPRPPPEGMARGGGHPRPPREGMARGADPPRPPREGMARGHASGREGVVRVLVAAGIMLAPSLGAGTVTLLSNPDHVGTQVPMLLIWLLLDRASPGGTTPPKPPPLLGGNRSPQTPSAPLGWVPVVVVTVLLAWVQVGDPLVLYEGVVPLVLVCAIRMIRRRGGLADNRYELALAGGAIVSAGAASVALKAIHRLGGFALRPPAVALTHIGHLPANVWVAVQSVLLLFGADFSGGQRVAHIGIAVVHLAGVALAAWAAGRALRRFGSQDLVVQVLTVTLIVLLVAYVIRGNPNVTGSTHEIAGVLPIGAVLAGRLLAGTLARGRPLIPALALMLGCYAGIEVHNAVQQRPADPDAQVAAWLAAHHLGYGLGDYWNANAMTLDGAGRVQVRYVSRIGDTLAARPWESAGSWFDPARHDATFLVTPGPASVCSPGTPGGWEAAGRATFGPPSGTYRVAGFVILVWHKNLLADLATVAPHSPIRC